MSTTGNEINLLSTAGWIAYESYTKPATAAATFAKFLGASVVGSYVTERLMECLPFSRRLPDATPTFRETLVNFTWMGSLTWAAFKLYARPFQYALLTQGLIVGVYQYALASFAENALDHCARFQCLDINRHQARVANSAAVGSRCTSVNPSILNGKIEKAEVTTLLAANIGFTILTQNPILGYAAATAISKAVAIAMKTMYRSA